MILNKKDRNLKKTCKKSPENHCFFEKNLISWIYQNPE